MVEYAQDFENGVDGANVTSAKVTPATLATINAGLTYRSSSALFGSLGVLFDGRSYYPMLTVAVGSSPPITYSRLYIRFTAPPTTNRTFLMMAASIVLQINANATIILRQSTIKATSAPIILYEWMRLEWTHDYANLVDKIDLFTGSNVHGDTPSQTFTIAMATAAYTFTRIGGSSLDTSLLFDVDAVAVSTTAMPAKIAPPSLPGNADMFLWDGTTMVAVDAFAWDGTTMVAADPSV